MVQSTDKKLKRRCDIFSNVISQVNAQLRLNAILADPFAKLVNNTIIKVNQGTSMFCFVLFLFMGNPFSLSPTRLVHPFPYLDTT